MLGRVALVVLLLGLPGTSALAQSTCPLPARGPYETTPISGSSGVATNAIVRARYPAGHFDAFSETLVLRDEEGAAVPGTLDVVGSDTLFFVPDEHLASNRWYTAIASGIDVSLEASFRTGASLDLAPPSAPRLLEAEAGRASPTCAQPEGGIRLSFLFETSSDDAGVASLQYGLYRTRGPELAAPALIARVPQEVAPGETQSIGAVLTEIEAAGVSCFVLVAEDGLLRTTASEELCFEPGIGVIFDSLCSTSDPESASRGLLPTAVVLLFLLGRARRRSAA
jgi:MYXO-CTERM domain-containing protein